MKISVSHARQELADLMRRAQRGEDVILTLRGEMSVRLVPIGLALERTQLDYTAKETLVEASKHR